MVILLVVLAILVGVFVLTVLFGAPYVSSHRSDLEDAFTNLRPLDKKDVLLDLGGGDGVVCLEACKRGARSVNYEINPFLVLVSKFRLRSYRSRYSSKFGNYLQGPFPKDVTVVYVFSESRHISGIYKKAQAESNRQKRSFDLVSYGFEIPSVRYTKRSNTHFMYRIEPLLN